MGARGRWAARRREGRWARGAVFTCAEGSAQLTAAAAGASFFKEPLRRLPLAAPRPRHGGAGPERAARTHCLCPTPGGRRRTEAVSSRPRAALRRQTVPSPQPERRAAALFRAPRGAARSPVLPSGAGRVGGETGRGAPRPRRSAASDGDAPRGPGPALPPPRDAEGGAAPPQLQAPHVAHVRAGLAPPRGTAPTAPVRAPRRAEWLRVGAAAAPRGSVPFPHARTASRRLWGPAEASGTAPPPGRHVRSAALSVRLRSAVGTEPLLLHSTALTKHRLLAYSPPPSSKTHAVLPQQPPLPCSYPQRGGDAHPVGTPSSSMVPTPKPPANSPNPPRRVPGPPLFPQRGNLIHQIVCGKEEAINYPNFCSLFE